MVCVCACLIWTVLTNTFSSFDITDTCEMPYYGTVWLVVTWELAAAGYFCRLAAAVAAAAAA